MFLLKINKKSHLEKKRLISIFSPFMKSTKPCCQYGMALFISSIDLLHTSNTNKKLQKRKNEKS